MSHLVLSGPFLQLRSVPCSVLWPRRLCPRRCVLLPSSRKAPSARPALWTLYPGHRTHTARHQCPSRAPFTAEGVARNLLSRRKQPTQRVLSPACWRDQPAESPACEVCTRTTERVIRHGEDQAHQTRNTEQTPRKTLEHRSRVCSSVSHDERGRSSHLKCVGAGTGEGQQLPSRNPPPSVTGGEERMKESM